MTDIQKSFRELISLAIEREVEAYNFYMNAAEQAELKSSAQLLRELAVQEQHHKEKLEAALDEGVCDTFSCTEEEFEKLNLKNYLAEVPFRADSSPQDILVVAIKREENAHAFYEALAGTTTSAGHKSVFETLAKEELQHKQRLEHMYDDIFQPDM
ncbi:MAG: ferritin family protein [Candidatus Thorarchaeota archaeon]